MTAILDHHLRDFADKHIIFDNKNHGYQSSSDCYQGVGHSSQPELKFPTICNSFHIYTAYFRTRKSEGLITRKLSVTESRRASQFRGTSRVRKVIVFVLKSRNVA